jgi:membrane associated rhomboid family serine protease
MLDDRSYMRSPSFGSGRSLTLTLIVTLIVLFVLQACLELYAGFPLDHWFALSLDGFKNKRFWQLLTFQFMHSTPWPWHVLFNCLALFFLGRAMEETLGKKDFLKLYFASGFCGGALSLLTTWLLPHHPDFPVLGASAGIMGLLAAYAMLFPMRDITIFIMFIPVNIRVYYLFWLVLGISAFGAIVPFDDTAHAAHLGGLLMGVAFIRWGRNPTRNWIEWNPFQRKLRRERMIKAATVRAPHSKFRRRPQIEYSQDLPSEEFISKEVDPILDKISAHGIQSLTPRERDILQAARARMSKR